jgi:hypothetical protein
MSQEVENAVAGKDKIIMNRITVSTEQVFVKSFIIKKSS